MNQTVRVSVPDASWIDSLTEYGGLDLVEWDAVSPQPDGHLDLVVYPYALGWKPLAKFDTSRIGLIQSQALGYDGVADCLPAGGVFSNAVGVHEESTAELAVALMLASQRQLDVFARQQAVGEWARSWSSSLVDKRILLIGVGGIGREIAARLDGFGSELVRMARTSRDDKFGRIHGINELFDALPKVDIVVVAVPLDESTHGLVDDKFLAALPDGALVVNISRGKITDTEAIVRAAGRVRYATDVTDPEPLPSEHPLWSAPGVLISPHVGGMSSAMQPRIESVVRDQIERLADGAHPVNVVVRT